MTRSPPRNREVSSSTGADASSETTYRSVPTGVSPSMIGDSAIGMPFWMLTRRPISWVRFSSSAASRSRAAARSDGAHDDQPAGSSKARRAAATAASMSPSAPSGTVPTCSPVEALRTSIVAAELGGAQSPPMNRVSWLVVMGGPPLDGVLAD
jgi:hypothetical protein